MLDNNFLLYGSAYQPLGGDVYLKGRLCELKVVDLHLLGGVGGLEILVNKPSILVLQQRGIDLATVYVAKNKG